MFDDVSYTLTVRRGRYTLQAIVTGLPILTRDCLSLNARGIRPLMASRRICSSGVD
jgi:hypothetical protein